jgi:hypothetical protein
MTKAQDDHKALIKKHRPLGGSGTGMGWIKKLPESVQKKIAAAKKAADASVDSEVSLGQRTSEGLLPDLPRGKTGTKREVAEATKAAKAAKAQAKSDKQDDATRRTMKNNQRRASSPTGNIPDGLSKSGSNVSVLKKTPAKTPDRTAKDIANARKSVTDNYTEAPKRKNITKKKDSLESALDSVKSLVSSVTPKMESFFGLNRSDEQIEKDMAVTAELEERDSRGGKKKGGRVSKPSRKKYSMNRGGKVASVRKPTRA